MFIFYIGRDDMVLEKEENRSSGRGSTPLGK